MGADKTGKRLKGEVWSSEREPHELASIVGQAIRTARMRRGWTQVQLAETAGLSGNYVARLERGELGPSLAVALQLTEVLGVSLDALVREPRAGGAPRTTTRRRAGK